MFGITKPENDTILLRADVIYVEANDTVNGIYIYCIISYIIHLPNYKETSQNNILKSLYTVYT